MHILAFRDRNSKSLGLSAWSADSQIINFKKLLCYPDKC